MDLEELSKNTFKLVGSVILLSAGIHLSIIFYHLSFGAEQVVVTEPNTLLVKLELFLALAGTCYAAYLIYRAGTHVLNNLSQE